MVCAISVGVCSILGLIGDGTTTATVLAQAILREGMKAVAAGMDPMDLKRGIDKGAAAAIEVDYESLPVVSDPERAIDPDPFDDSSSGCAWIASNTRGLSDTPVGYRRMSDSETVETRDYFDKARSVAAAFMFAAHRRWAPQVGPTVVGSPSEGCGGRCAVC